jgi:hypothetical protein
MALWEWANRQTAARQDQKCRTDKERSKKGKKTISAASRYSSGISLCSETEKVSTREWRGCCTSAPAPVPVLTTEGAAGERVQVHKRQHAGQERAMHCILNYLYVHRLLLHYALHVSSRRCSLCTAATEKWGPLVKRAADRRGLLRKWGTIFTRVIPKQQASASWNRKQTKERQVDFARVISSAADKRRPRQCRRNSAEFSVALKRFGVRTLV